jgi:hypothetical protein
VLYFKRLKNIKLEDAKTIRQSDNEMNKIENLTHIAAQNPLKALR